MDGSGRPGIFQSEVLAVDGERVGSADEVYARVAGLPPGTAVRYRLERGGVEREVTVPTDRFLVRDWFLLFGAFLLNGAVTFAAGLVPWLAPSTRAAAACAPHVR